MKEEFIYGLELSVLFIGSKKACYSSVVIYYESVRVYLIQWYRNEKSVIVLRRSV